MGDHEGRALSIALRQPVDGWDDQEAGAECRDASEQGRPYPCHSRIALIHVVHDDEPGESSDRVVGVEDAKGRDTDLLKGSAAQRDDDALKQLGQRRSDGLPSGRCFRLGSVVGGRGTKNRRHHGKKHADAAYPDGKCTGALGGAIKPVGVVKNDPKPGRDDPGPLSNPLRHRHESRALVVVVAHLVTHGDVGHTEYG